MLPRLKLGNAKKERIAKGVNKAKYASCMHYVLCAMCGAHLVVELTWYWKKLVLHGKKLTW